MQSLTAADFDAGRVTNPGQSEGIRQSLYDALILPGAGAQTLSFFQSQVGQGITSALGAVAGTPKTLADTNMTLSGQLSSGLSQLVESIELMMYPGSVSTANTYTIKTLSFFAAVAAITVTAQVDDVSTFYNGGYLNFSVLAKPYLTEAPLRRFPPKTVIEISGFGSSNSATTSEVGAAVANAAGRPYYLDPSITLQPAMNFSLTLNWPAVVAMPSGFNARVVCILDGYQARASQ